MRHVRLKSFLILIPIASVVLAVSGCPTNAPKMQWDGKVYLGDSKSQVLVRRDKGVVEWRPTNDPFFDTVVCTSQEDFTKLQQSYFDVLNKCEKWRP